MSTNKLGYQNPHSNWIPDTNRFKVEQPPDWFLTGLYNYDDQLVLLPSRMRRQYLLARKRKYTVGLGDVAMLDNKHPDTNMCYAHKVLPIAPLRWAKTNTDAGAFTKQNLDSLLDTLRERDAWARGEEMGIGGGPNVRNPDAIVDSIEAFEREEACKKDRAIWQNFHHMGRDAWRSLTARIGARNRRASDFHGVARKPQSEQRVILTDAQ